MATYALEIVPSALKQLAAIPNESRQRLSAAITELRQTPRPDGVKKLKGKQAGLYRIRLGSFRVIYSINDKVLHILVVWIGQRGGAY